MVLIKGSDNTDYITPSGEIHDRFIIRFYDSMYFIANSKQKDIKEEKYNENTRNQS